MMLVFGFWQAIKPAYRQFLSKGERTQAVNVSVSERIEWLAQVMSEVDVEMMIDGWRSGLQRLSYIEYFGHTMIVVPSQIPHTNGLLWKEALTYPLMPRIFFPNKPAIEDSTRTNAYSGMQVATAEEGTSISIGYVGESYIDFGRWGMFVPIFLLGLLVGWCYEYVRRKAPHPLLGSALASCLILSKVIHLEYSNLSLVGGLLSAFLGTVALLHLFGNHAWSWLTGGGERKENAESLNAKTLKNTE